MGGEADSRFTTLRRLFVRNHDSINLVSKLARHKSVQETDGERGLMIQYEMRETRFRINIHRLLNTRGTRIGLKEKLGLAEQEGGMDLTH